MERKKFKQGDLVRYTQQIFDFGTPEDTLYDKQGWFVSYIDEEKCQVHFKGISNISIVEILALEPVVH